MKKIIQYKSESILFSNEDLKEGDEVFLLGVGYIEDGVFNLVSVNLFPECATGFPNNPHKIIDLNYSSGSYQVKTDKGYGSKECYFKILTQ